MFSGCAGGLQDGVQLGEGVLQRGGGGGFGEDLEGAERAGEGACAKDFAGAGKPVGEAAGFGGAAGDKVGGESCLAEPSARQARTPATSCSA